MNAPVEKDAPLFRQKCFFWCCAALSLLALLGSNSLFWVEPLIAEAAREIAVTGNWHPLTINFRECSGLPVLEVWSVALFFRIGVSEFAARLPSALAAIALLIGTIELTKQLYDRRTALLAGWLTLGTFGVLYMGRCCGSGVFSGAFAVWAVVLYLRGDGRKSFWYALGLSTLLALGVLNRGLGFLWLPGALLLPWLVSKRRHFEPRVAAAVAVAAVALYAAWVIVLGEPFIALCKWLWRIMAVEGAGTAVKRWCTTWWSGRNAPLWMGLADVPRIMLPWALLLIAAFVGALCRFRRVSPEERCILTGIVLGFVVLAFPASSRRTDFLPLVPFLALETGIWVLRGEGGRLSRWAVVATRMAIVLAASFGTVSVVTIPVWQQLVGIDLPTLFWAACFLFGAAILVIMMLDCYPTHPLPRLTGLPDPLGSTILGGTLASICLISFLLPSLREMREEKAFLQRVRARISEMEPSAIVNIGGRSSTALLLFYAGIPGPITVVSDRGGDRELSVFSKAVAEAPGRRVAVLTLYRGKEQAFLRRCAEETGLKIDVGDPTLLEGTPSDSVSNYRRRAFYLAYPDRGNAGEN